MRQNSYDELKMESELMNFLGKLQQSTLKGEKNFHLPFITFVFIANVPS